MRGHVGQPIPHDSATKHVTGEARYIDDIPTPPDTLHVQIGMSERAHARVVSLDLANVLAAPGVVAVLTAADIPGDNDVAPTPTHDDPIVDDGVEESVVDRARRELPGAVAETQGLFDIHGADLQLLR